MYAFLRCCVKLTFFFSNEFGSTFTVAGSPIAVCNVTQSMILYFFGGLLEIFINPLLA